jgi:hypothetical protein
MQWMAVADVAGELGLSSQRVRQLIDRGVLEAVKLSGRWLIRDESVERLAGRPRRAGRPWAAPRAWALLALACDREPTWLPEAEWDRLRDVLAASDIEDLVAQLHARAERRDWYVHPGLLAELRRHDGVVVGGGLASGRLRDSGSVDLYIHPDVLRDLVASYAPDEDPDEPNVVIHVVQGPWPFVPGEREAWPAVAAADLLDRGDSRSRQVAAELLADA